MGDNTIAWGAVLRDWGRRWIEQRDKRKGLTIPVGSTPPWETITAARELNDELDILLTDEGLTAAVKAYDEAVWQRRLDSPEMLFRVVTVVAQERNGRPWSDADFADDILAALRADPKVPVLPPPDLSIIGHEGPGKR